jgi:hypothetical protein
MIDASEQRVNLAEGGKRLVRRRELARRWTGGGRRNVSPKRKRSLRERRQDDDKHCRPHDPAAEVCWRAKRS